MDIAATFNLSEQDIALLLTCPLLASLASTIRAWICELDLLHPPAYESIFHNEMECKRKQTKENRRERGYWIVGMLLGGLGIGLGVAFLFLGAIQPTASAVGRLWFLSLALGYATPIVLKNVDKTIEKKLTRLSNDS